MEADKNALDSCCRELFPIIDMTQQLLKAVGLIVGVTLMKISVHKDNYGVLILSRTFPQKFTPRSKYYATKTILFREEINKRKIVLFKIAAVEQLGDLFTKCLHIATFEQLWNKVTGW